MRRFKSVVVLAVLGVLAAVFFWPVLAHPDHLMTSGRGDLVQLFAARTHYQVTNTLKSGELTLWDPYADCGAPVVGNVQNATFYPLSILFYIMPTDGAFGFIFLADTLLAGWFAYLFVRSFGLSRGAGLAGAITYMFSGIWTPKLFPGHIMHYNNLPWIILGLYLVRKVVLSARDGKWSAGLFFALLLAISQAIQFLGGHTQFWVYSTFFLVVFGLFEIFCGFVMGGSLRTVAGGVLIFAALAVCAALVMIQLLPAIEFAGQVLDEGKRPAGYRASGIFISAEGVMALVPRYYGSAEQNSYWGYDLPWEVSPYVGILPLILALGAPFIVRNRYVWYFCAAGICALLFSLGEDSLLFRLLVQLPGFSAFRFPVRMLMQALPAVVVLSAFAWDRLFSNQSHGSKWIRIITVGIALLMAAYMARMFVWHQIHETQIKADWRQGIKRAHDQFRLPAYQMSYGEAKERASGSFAEVQRELVIGAAICVVSAGLFVLAGRGGMVRSACGLVALVIISADLMSFGMPFIGTLSVDDIKVYPEHTALLDRLNDLAKDKPPFRICDYHSPIGSQMVYHHLRRRDFNMVSGDIDSSKLKDIQEYDNYKYDDIRVLNDVLSAFNVKYYVSDKPMREYQKEAEQRAPPKEVALSAPETAAVVLGDSMPAGDVYVTENLECFERAFVVRKVVPMVGDTSDDIMAFLVKKKIMKNLAAIEETPDFTLNGKGGFQNARVTDYRPNRVTVEVSLDEPGFLVLSEVWYPDWRAYDVADGGRSELHVYKTNLAMRGVFLKAGKHKVEFVYEPSSYYEGKTITLISLPVVLVLLVFFGLVARRRSAC